MQKKMTIEKLAMMVANGFKKMGERFDSLEKEMRRIDGDVDGIKKRIRHNDSSEARQDAEIDVLKSRVGEVEAGFL